MLNIRINFDGACDNGMYKRTGIYPPMGLGIAVFINNSYCEELSKFVGIERKILNSSNEAEWLACIEAFKLISELKTEAENDEFEVQSDSQLITKQYNGDYEINKIRFKDYIQQARRFAIRSNLGSLKINWVRREFNKEADRLSKLGLQLITGNDSKPVSSDHKPANKRA